MSRRNEMCTIKQLNEILRLCKKEQYYLLFFCFSKTMASKFIQYLNNTIKYPPKYFNIYFSKENLRYNIWNDYCISYKIYKIQYYDENREYEEILEDLYDLEKDELNQTLNEICNVFNIKNPSYEDYFFLRPIECIEGAYGDGLNMYSPYYQYFNNMLFCGSCSYLNCPNHFQSGMEMFLWGSFYTKKVGNIFHCDDFGDDCLCLSNNTKQEYIEWFHNLIESKKEKITNKEIISINDKLNNFNYKNNTTYMLKNIDLNKLNQMEFEKIIYYLSDNKILEEYFEYKTRYDFEKEKLLSYFKNINYNEEINYLFHFYSKNIYKVNRYLEECEIIDLILYKKNILESLNNFNELLSQKDVNIVLKEILCCNWDKSINYFLNKNKKYSTFHDFVYNTKLNNVNINRFEKMFNNFKKQFNEKEFYINKYDILFEKYFKDIVNIIDIEINNKTINFKSILIKIEQLFI